MNKWVIVLIILAVGFMLINNRKEKGYQTMTPAEAKAILAQDKNVVLLDVRTKEEYAEKHIGGSVLIPLNVLEEQVEKKVPNKEQKVIVYCRSGNRSRTAVNALIKMGYTNVYDLGGINSWPYETR